MCQIKLKTREKRRDIKTTKKILKWEKILKRETSLQVPLKVMHENTGRLLIGQG